MRTPHTRCPKGKRVFVTLRDGRQFTDHFEAYGSAWVRFRLHGIVAKGDLRFMTIARGAASEAKKSEE